MDDPKLEDIKILNILEIGPGNNPQAQGVWTFANIDTMDVNPEVKPTYLRNARTMPEELYDKYDVILAYHVLEHFPYWDTIDVLKEWGKVMKAGGELHVVVPSLEWVARQVLSEKPSRAILPHLHAGLVNEWDVHLASFTMRNLRTCFEKADFAVARARSDAYSIKVVKEVMEAEQHYILGIKK